MAGLHTAWLMPAASAKAPRLLARRPIIGLGLFLLGGAAFGVLAWSVRTNGILLRWDEPIIQALHVRATHDNALDFNVMRFTATLGRETAVGLTVILLVITFLRRHWAAFSMLLVGVIGGNVWFEVLSAYFARHRPSFPDPLDPLPGPGFPSGHTMSALLLYGLLAYLLLPHLASARWRLLAVLEAGMIALSVGYSRLYMGAHFPTDVLAGYAFGLAWGALVYTAIELVVQWRAAHTRPRLTQQLRGGAVR